MPSKQLRPKLYSLCGHKDSGLTSVKDVSKSLPPLSGAGLWSPGRLVEAPPRVLQPCTAGSWELQLGIILHVKGLLSRVLSDIQSYIQWSGSPHFQYWKEKVLNLPYMEKFHGLTPLVGCKSFIFSTEPYATQHFLDLLTPRGGGVYLSPSFSLSSWRESLAQK